MVSFRCFCAGSRVFACSVIHQALGQCGKAKKASGKKRAGSVIRKERKTEGREKKRACKHLFKCLNPPTCRKTVSCVKTSKGALV